MQISVALATYNGGLFIREQLASLAGQTKLPAELIVSDDGSTDQTLSIVREFAKTAPFRVVVASNSAPLGYADNFLRAASSCSHGLIAFCDQDDIWLPRKLEIGAARIEGDRSLLSMHTLTVTDDTLRPIGFEWDQGIDADRVVAPLAVDPFATGWGNTMLFRRELLDAITSTGRPAQPFEKERHLSHDTWIYVLASALGRVSWIATPLVLYRQHSNTATIATAAPRRRRLRSAVTVPMLEFPERIAFYNAMALLLGQLALEDSTWAVRASTAAVVYKQRAAWWSARRAIFSGPTACVRWRAFQSFHELNHPRGHSLASRLKDITLGVSGIARRFHAQKRSV